MIINLKIRKVMSISKINFQLNSFEFIEQSNFHLNDSINTNSEPNVPNFPAVIYQKFP